MPRQGDIVFYKSNGSLIQSLVSFFSRASHDIVHVAIYVDEDKTIEANFSKRVGYATISEYDNEHIIKSYKSITDEQRKKIIEYCKERFGEPYDLLQILELFLKYFGIRMPYTEKRMKICSTLVRDAYLYAGIELTLNADSSPEQLFDNNNLETEE